MAAFRCCQYTAEPTRQAANPRYLEFMTTELLTPQKYPEVAGATEGCFKRIVPSHIYHADKDILSSTMIKPILQSPADYIEALLNFKRTKAMDYGTLLHMQVLEPHTRNEVVAIYPGPLDCPEGRAFVAANNDRICISLADYLQLESASAVVRASLFRGRPFYKFIEEGEVEPSIYYTDPITGLACRTRPDLFHPEFTFDLKSTRHASTSAFQRDAVDLHYDLQAFMYSLARCTFEGTTKPKPFVFVKITSETPTSTHFMPCVDDFIQNGYEKYAAALAAIKACTIADHWPAPQGEVAMELLPWQSFKNSSKAWSGAEITG